MTHTLEIVVGDWSDDGHGKTHTVVIKTNLSAKEVESAFKAGVKVCGYDITEYCHGYEDGEIPTKLYHYFENLGVQYENVEDEREEGKKTQGICSPDYANIWLKTCQIGNPNFTYEISSNYENKINIGGYGLFWG